MKYFVIFLFISLLSITSFSQKKLVIPDLKAGIGYPFVFNNVKGNSEHYTINGLPTVSVEMPFAIEYKRRNRFSINPGLAYYFF